MLQNLDDRVRVVPDVEYSRPAGEPLHLDLYLPKPTNAPAPVILWIHGADWRHSDFARGSRSPCPVAWYANHGYAVASVSYRLAPKARFPDQIIDCKAAARWLRANARAYDLDTDRIVAWGFGGGSLLASLMGSTAHLEEFEQGPFLDQISRVSAVIDVNGTHYLYWGENNSRSAYWVTCYFNSFQNAQLKEAGPESAEFNLLGCPPSVDPKRALLASPASHIATCKVPTLIVTGTESRISPFVQRTRYLKELRKAGADVTALYLNDVGHGGSDLYAHPVIDAFLASRVKGEPCAESGRLGKINASGRGQETRTFDRFTDEGNAIMMSSTTVNPWDNAVKGFTHPLTRPRRFFSKAVGAEVEYLVYLPSSYDREPERRYPTLYFMATGAQPIREYALDFVELAHAAAASGSCPEMIVVVPTNSFIATRRKRARHLLGNLSERMLRDDFIPHIDATYRTIASREGRALQGGCGGSAENIAFVLRDRKPLFGLVSIAAPIHDGTLFPLFWKRRGALSKDMTLQLCYDESDSLGTGAHSMRLVGALKRMGAPFQRFAPRFGGVHNWNEYLIETEGNGFDLFVKRFGAFDPRLAAPALSPDTSVVRDLVYAKRGDKSLRLDLYRPARAAGPLPIVVWLHGTDWRGKLFDDGSKYPCPAAFLADRGYAVASVEYRHSGDEPFPAQVQDVQAAARWLRSRAAQYGLDGARLALCGESAGGALASLAALLGVADPGAAPDRSVAQDLGAKAVICCGAPFDLAKLDAMRWRDVLNGGAWQANSTSGVSKFLGRRAPESLSPIAFASSKAPPFLLAHGSEDTVVSPRQSGLMHRALLAAGAESYLEIVNGGGHGFATLRERAADAMVAFLDDRLMGEKEAFSSMKRRLRPRVNALGSVQYPSFKDPIARQNADASYRSIASVALGEELSFLVSEPPRYETDARAAYPVLYLLPDGDESPRDYLNYAQAFREAILAGAAPEAILVIVNSAAGGCYDDPKRLAAFESAFVGELLPHVESRWRARADRAGRLVEGFGQGASVAAGIAIGRSDLFASVSLVDPRAEPAGMAGCGIAERLAVEAPRSQERIVAQLVEVSRFEGASLRIEALRATLSEGGAQVSSVRADLGIDDRLIVYLESDFDVFAFHRRQLSQAPRCERVSARELVAS